MAHDFRVSGMAVVLAALLLGGPGVATAQSAGNVPAVLARPGATRICRAPGTSAP